MTLSVYEKQYKYCPTCKTKLQRKLIDERERFFCPKCNFIFWNNPKPVVSILLHKDKKILMVQRAEKPLKNYWCLPGGYIDYEETPQEAVIRETKEEVGIELSEVGRLIGAYRIDSDPRGVNIDIIYEGEINYRGLRALGILALWARRVCFLACFIRGLKTLGILTGSKIKTKDIKLSKEHGKYKFFSKDNLPKKIAYKHWKAIDDWVKKRC